MSQTLDFINLRGLTTTACEDCGGHYRVTVKGTEEPCLCPECSGLFFHKHGTQTQSYMDTPMHGKRVLLEVARQRYKCQDCHKTFFAPLSCIDGRRQATKRLITYIEQRCMQETFVALAREVGVDEKTIRHIFDDYDARMKQEVKFKTPEILGIDEVKIIGDYRAMLTNIDKLSVFDLISSRKQNRLIEYFDQLPDKQNVHTLVMDMWNPYRLVSQKMFPGRMIVVDKFHVVKMANVGFDRARIRMKDALHRGTRVRLKKERFTLLRREKSLTEAQSAKAEKWLNQFPQLRVAYEAKERICNIYNQPTRAAAEKEATLWSTTLAPEIEKDFRDLRVALHNWNREIFNYYEQPVTNAYTEAVNGIAGLINRIGRGYSFEVLRARLLYNKQAIDDASTTIRKRGRRQKPTSESEYSYFTIGRSASFGESYEEERTNYGAYLPTLINLLEDGYFS